MSAVPATEASLVDTYHAEWRLLSEHPFNVLLEGTVTATDAALRRLRRHIREPIVWQQPPAPLDLPSDEAHALILRDAAALSRDEQRRLLEWMGGTGSRTQVISTATRPLFALVAAGLFDAALYYRLNVLLLRVTAPFQPGLRALERGGRLEPVER
jgi:sigma-54-interacting transcriptional regulator